MSPSIVLYGHDKLLLYTRAEILKKAGFRVRLTSSLSNDDFCRKCDADLLILCQTLSPEECHSALHMAPLLWPGIKTLVLVTSADERAPCSPGRVFVVFGGHATLLETVYEMIGEPIFALSTSTITSKGDPALCRNIQVQ